MPMIRIAGFALAVVWFSSPAIFASQALSADAPEDPVSAVVLRHWPPHYLTDEKTGAPGGFAIEIMDRVAALSGVAVRYTVYRDWPEAFEALRSGRAILAPNLGMTDARLGLYDFTMPYETFRIGIFVRKATADISDIDALAGRAVGVVQDNQGLVLMQRQGGSDLFVYQSLEEAFMALLAGGVDALVYPEGPLRAIAIRAGLDGKIKVVGRPLQEIKRGIAVRKGNPEVFAKVDRALRQFLQTQEFREIFQKWYGRPEPFWNVVRVAAAMGTLLGMSVLALVAWRYVSTLRINRYLAEAETRFRSIIENTAAGYFFIDRDGRFRNVNQAWLTLHGYTGREEIIGQPFGLTQVDSDMETARRDVAALLAGAPIPTGEATRRCRDGSIGHHTFSAHPVVQGGRIVGLEGFIIDTTDAHRVAEEKRTLEDRLWRVRKAESLARMAGAIAHHFNNQLAVVQGSLELALEDLIGSENARETLGEALQAARRAVEISGMMLTYLGQDEARSAPLDLSAVCRRQVPVLRAALPAGVALETNLMDAGPVVCISGQQVQRVLTHLVGNAVEAVGTRDGRVLLTTGICAAPAIRMGCIAPADWKPQADRYGYLEVADSGCGMTARDRDRLFDPFFTTKFTGRGLGLPVVLGIARASRGAVGVETVIDRGTVIRVFLPLSSETPVRPTDAAAAAPGTGLGGPVLLVEDQEAVRRMVTAMLGRLGYAVVGAATGGEALELFARHRKAICCVVTDLTMPDMDGRRILAALRQGRPDLPVILTSGYDEARAMGIGADEMPDAFLSKPYSKEELRRALDQAMGR